jgi:mannan endo-1,4-beta-mannosidase
MITRRSVLASGPALAAGCAPPPAAGGFVKTEGVAFQIDGAPYRYAGANIWYGAYLGAASAIGNRDRLRAELDTLQGLGITNLRVLGSGEISPLRNSLNPAFRDQSETYNEELLVGLDFLLAEMAARGMHAVLYLTNFWEWSGGMAT